MEAAALLELRAPGRVPADVESPLQDDQAEKLEDPGRLLCRECGEPITSRADETPVAGSRVHRRTNPAGVSFTFGCFGAAPGTTVVGPATDEHSWFAGCVWSFALCGGCAEQLGWLFEGADRFYGLILDRLVEEARPTHH